MVKGEPSPAVPPRPEEKSPRPVWFHLPRRLRTNVLLQAIGANYAVARERPHVRRRCYFDSFDWRLYEAGTVLVHDRSDPGALPRWEDLVEGRLKHLLPEHTPPRFAHQLPPGAARDALAAALDHRALLPVVEVEGREQVFRVLDAAEKTVARLVHLNRITARRADTASEAPRPLAARFGLLPVKGYAGAYHSLRAALQARFSLEEAPSLLHGALEAVGRLPADYTSRFVLPLDPVQRTDAALCRIFRALLDTMTRNLPGLRADLDPEFLHDFRVAVRRTRVALSQSQDVFPPGDAACFAAGFRWLHRTTGPTRDLDVYLLQIDAYQASLPEDLRADLEPLRSFLHRQQQRAHQALCEALASDHYHALIDAWRRYLEDPPPRERLPNAARPVLEVASEYIWRQYRKVLKQGRKIGPDTPARALHALRLRCKKLRYLMELFHSLYPQASLERLIRALKRLQDNLGDVQDLQVQQQKLQRYARQMLEEDQIPAATLLTMGRLESLLERRQHAARTDFARIFARFDRKQNRHLFEALFRDHVL